MLDRQLLRQAPSLPRQTRSRYGRTHPSRSRDRPLERWALERSKIQAKRLVNDMWPLEVRLRTPRGASSARPISFSPASHRAGSGRLRIVAAQHAAAVTCQHRDSGRSVHPHSVMVRAGEEALGGAEAQPIVGISAIGEDHNPSRHLRAFGAFGTSVDAPAATGARSVPRGRSVRSAARVRDSGLRNRLRHEQDPSSMSSSRGIRVPRRDTKRRERRRRIRALSVGSYNDASAGRS